MSPGIYSKTCLPNDSGGSLPRLSARVTTFRSGNL